MQIDILTLFPEMFAPLEHSIIKRARDAGHVKVNLVNFRDWANNKHKQVDDTPYGGGAGMVLAAPPIVECIESIDPNHKAHRICLTPAAAVLNQTRVREIAKLDRIILLCGHYEGIDQRAIDLCMDECISIGEYVLTGGEIPAMVVVDAVSRFVPGVINQNSAENESPIAYTKPREYRGMSVPEVLLNGNHAEIQKWRSQK